MRRVALKGMLGRKLRTVLTALAIVIGVSMISGTFVLTDTIDRAFHSIFVSSYAQTDAVISGKKLVDWSASGNPTIPASVLAKVRTLPEVGQAEGAIIDFDSNSDLAPLLDRDGKVISSEGYGFGIDPSAERFNPFRLTEGRWAAAPDEVVVDADTASGKHFAPGDSIRVTADGPTRSYRVVGVLKFGDLSSLGGATIALFTVGAARDLLHKPGLDSIAVAAADGVSSQQLLAALREVVPANVQVKSGAEQASSDEKDVAGLMTLHPRLPARVRRRRPVRRRLRHLQHALDHDRAADAGVRDAADARGFAAAGAALDPARVRSDRSRRLARRARGGRRPGEAAGLADVGPRPRRCRRRRSSSLPGRSSSRSPSACWSRCWPACCRR